MNEAEQYKFDKKVWFDLLLDVGYDWPDEKMVETIMTFGKESDTVFTEDVFLALYAFICYEDCNH